mmetsp:Transcript_28282/g.79840  ORF Transcript_28282/g.79840 Transcript_28282/m.79840 type:complete len:337 (-) Transcript_28282:569-1579(-)
MVSTISDADALNHVIHLQLVQHALVFHYVPKDGVVSVQHVGAAWGDLRFLVEEEELCVRTVGLKLVTCHGQGSLGIEWQHHLFPHEAKILLGGTIGGLLLSLIPHLHGDCPAGRGSLTLLTGLHHKAICPLNGHAVVEALLTEVHKVPGSDGGVDAIQYHRQHAVCLTTGLLLLHLDLSHGPAPQLGERCILCRDRDICHKQGLQLSRDIEHVIFQVEHSGCAGVSFPNFCQPRRHPFLELPKQSLCLGEVLSGHGSKDVVVALADRAVGSADGCLQGPGVPWPMTGRLLLHKDRLRNASGASSTPLGCLEAADGKEGIVYLQQGGELCFLWQGGS